MSIATEIQMMPYKRLILCWFKAFSLAALINPVGIVFFALLFLFVTASEGTLPADSWILIFYYALGLVLVWPLFLAAAPISLYAAIRVKRNGRADLRYYLRFGLLIAFISGLIGTAFTSWLFLSQIPADDEARTMFEFGSISFANGVVFGAISERFGESLAYISNLDSPLLFNWIYRLSTLLTFCLFILPSGVFGGFLFHRFVTRL